MVKSRLPYSPPLRPSFERAADHTWGSAMRNKLGADSSACLQRWEQDRRSSDRFQEDPLTPCDDLGGLQIDPHVRICNIAEELRRES
jgi:hypothetical protein